MHFQEVLVATHSDPHQLWQCKPFFIWDALAWLRTITSHLDFTFKFWHKTLPERQKSWYQRQEQREGVHLLRNLPVKALLHPHLPRIICCRTRKGGENLIQSWIAGTLSLYQLVGGTVLLPIFPIRSGIFQVMVWFSALQMMLFDCIGYFHLGICWFVGFSSFCGRVEMFNKKNTKFPQIASGD